MQMCTSSVWADLGKQHWSIVGWLSLDVWEFARGSFSPANGGRTIIMSVLKTQIPTSDAHLSIDFFSSQSFPPLLIGVSQTKSALCGGPSSKYCVLYTYGEDR